MNILKWRKRYVFMDQANEGAGGGAGAGTGTNGSSATGGAGAGTGASGSGTGQAVAGGAGSTESLLATGAAGAGQQTTDFIPEKYRVTKEDGTLDLEASSRKLAEAYGHAEKRIGSGDVPPKTAEEYTVAVPDAFKESFNPAEDPGFKDFRAKAHAAGMTQAQMDLVMSQYFEMAPQLVAGAVMLDSQAATAELKKTWATEADFNRNVKNAYVGASALAQKAGMSIDEIMAPNVLGNNVMFLKLAAAIGPEFAEDSSPVGAQQFSQEDIMALMMSEAYKDPKHPDYAKTSAKVKAYFERKHGTEAAA